MNDDYTRYRGKCKELAEAAVAADPSLTLTRGHYWCPIWGKQQHWWTTRPDGTVFDPSARQFPSKGQGSYVPSDGIVECAQCGSTMEEEAVTETDGRYAFCSYTCHGRFIGVL